ncbi:MAG: hypothetical protein JKX84_01080 [Flavobacteriales bacterium]|nr:hypothetical protein [Flavobacteriales bacterium]
MKNLTERQREYFQRMKETETKKLAENAGLIQLFKQACIEKGITLSDENFEYIQPIGIVACYPNIVEKLCPQLSKDKEGLLDFGFLSNQFEKQPFLSGYFYADNFILMAHSYFRRSLHPNSNFAPLFVDCFWGINQPNIDSYIALDYNRVRINVDNSAYKEFDTWFGAKFNRKVTEIDDGTVKLRPPSEFDDDDISFFCADAYSLEPLLHTSWRASLVVTRP